jgi:hypothetical protein
MPDSGLNEAERSLQQSFRFSLIFSGLLMAVAVVLAYLPVRQLPDLHFLPDAQVPLSVRPVGLPAAVAPLRLAGAWELAAPDPRFTGLSALALDHGRLLAVSDRGAVIRFDFPTMKRPTAWLADLRAGPGPWGKKWSRDAESLAPDPQGRGWWVGYEQRHSLWLYEPKFRRAIRSINLNQPDWWDNQGAEGLLAEPGGLLVTAENGRDVLQVNGAAVERRAIVAGAEVAEAARAPDGSAWILLRTKGSDGVSQSIAPLIRAGNGYRSGPAWPVPKGAFDNFEGMAIEPRAAGGWRFWLVTDDGHRIMARTLLIALDYVPPARHDKSPATSTGLSKKPNGSAV